MQGSDVIRTILASVTPALYLEAVEARLAPLANPRRAIEMRAYMRNQFEFLGIRAPLRQKAVRDISKPPMSAVDVLRAAALLWEKPEREYRYSAADLLLANTGLLRLHHLKRIRKLIQSDPWWDTVDSLAAVVNRTVRAARMARADAQDVMDVWIKSPDMWVRRVAMIHQLGWRTETDAKRLFRHAETLAPERDFFIRKAVGWALRDFARWNPRAVGDYMQRRGHIFSGLTVREATKHLANFK